MNPLEQLVSEVKTKTLELVIAKLKLAATLKLLQGGEGLYMRPLGIGEIERLINEMKNGN